jgi:hypothetical protein
MRALLFSRHDTYFDLSKAAFFKELMQLHFAKAEPMVCIQFARPFEPMAQKIENHQAAAAFQNPVRRRDGFLRMNGVMQGLAQNCEIDTVFRNRRIFNVAEPVFEVLEAVLFCELRSEFDHLRRIIDGDDFARVFSEQLRKRPFAGPQVGNCQWREQGDERVCQRFP